MQHLFSYLSALLHYLGSWELNLPRSMDGVLIPSSSGISLTLNSISKFTYLLNILMSFTRAIELYGNCTVILHRQGWDNSDFIIIAANFSNWGLNDYYLAAPQAGNYQVALSTDWEQYGGVSRPWIPMQTENHYLQGLSYRFKISIPPLSLLMIKKV